MGLPSRRSGRPPTRAARQQRAYQLATIGGGAAVVTLVTGILAIVGVIGFTLPVIAAIVAVVCFVMFRGIVSPRR
jgi:hypothetical protein